MIEEQTTVATPLESLSGKDTIQLVTFEIDEEYFGIEVSCVQEVIKFDRLSPAPGALEIIEGVIDLRGDIIPVIDLRKLLKMATGESNEGTKILIVEVSEYVFGFIVDKVDEVSTFAASEFAPAPPGTNHSGSEYTVGVTHKDEKLLLYIDIEQVFNIKKIFKEVM